MAARRGWQDLLQTVPVRRDLSEEEHLGILVLGECVGLPDRLVGEYSLLMLRRVSDDTCLFLHIVFFFFFF